VKEKPVPIRLTIANDPTMIRTLVTGDWTVSPRFCREFEPKADQTPLSPREQEVLRLLAEGKSSKEMARRLYVTIKTIVWHRQNIMKKLGVRTIAGLTKYALRIGLTSLE